MKKYIRKIKRNLKELNEIVKRRKLEERKKELASDLLKSFMNNDRY